MHTTNKHHHYYSALPAQKVNENFLPTKESNNKIQQLESSLFLSFINFTRVIRSTAIVPGVNGVRIITEVLFSSISQDLRVIP